MFLGGGRGRGACNRSRVTRPAGRRIDSPREGRIGLGAFNPLHEFTPPLPGALPQAAPAPRPPAPVTGPGWGCAPSRCGEAAIPARDAERSPAALPWAQAPRLRGGGGG